MEVITAVVLLFVQLFLGIVLGVASIYLALRFFDRMTEGIDEIAELKRGNVAIAVVLLALIVSIGTLVGKGVMQFEAMFSQGLTTQMFIIAFVMAIVKIVVLLLVAILSIYIAIRVLDTMTVGIDELKELKRGNVAVALLVAAVIYIVAFVVSDAVAGISNLSIFSPETLAALFGVS